jgi:hypothetical protein
MIEVWRRLIVDEVFTGSSRLEGIAGTLADRSSSWIVVAFLWTAVREYGMTGHTLSKLFAFGEQVEICGGVGFC